MAKKTKTAKCYGKYKKSKHHAKKSWGAASERHDYIQERDAARDQDEEEDSHVDAKTEESHANQAGCGLSDTGHPVDQLE